MKRIAFMLIMFCAFTIKAQVNLVPNPSFEDTVNISTASNSLDFISHWYQPTVASTDAFLPFYLANEPRTGLAHIGMDVYDNTMPGWSEYSQVKLLQPLIEDEVYRVGYYYKLSDQPVINWPVIVKNMGFRFSLDSLLLPNSWGCLGENPPYSYSLDTSLFQLPVDTFSYMKLEYYYTAQGGEKYLTIGNFKSFNNTVVSYYNAYRPDTICYYLIDDIFVECLEYASYNCIAGACIDPANATGIYSTLADCQAECGVSAIEENNSTKQLLKITDVLGRESKPTPNVPLFYRYDDGTVEKRIVIE
jgi:hypothetical protein